MHLCIMSVGIDYGLIKLMWDILLKKIVVSHKAVHYSLLDLECTVLVSLSVVISLKLVLSLQGQEQ